MTYIYYLLLILHYTMKIGILTEAFLGGGLESNIETYANYLSSHQNEFTIITSTDLHVRNICQKSSYKIITELNSFSEQATQTAIKKLAHHFGEAHYDYLLIHPFLTFRTGVIAARKMGIPYSLFFHGPGSLGEVYGKDFTNFMSTKAIKYADYSFAVSKEIKHFIVSRYKARNVLLLPNPIAIDVTTPVRRQKMILIVARLDSDKIKSILHMLDFIQTDQSLGNYHILIAGEGTEEKTLKQIVKRKYMGNVSFLGYIKNADVFSITRKSAFTVGMGRVALEAMSTNTPILLAGYDGLKGFITPANFEKMAESNFSGRGIKNVDLSVLSEQLHATQKFPTLLFPLIQEQYSISILGARLAYLINCNLP